jgi:hypothetical protein
MISGNKIIKSNFVMSIMQESDQNNHELHRTRQKL